MPPLQIMLSRHTSQVVSNARTQTAIAITAYQVCNGNKEEEKTNEHGMEEKKAGDGLLPYLIEGWNMNYKR